MHELIGQRARRHVVASTGATVVALSGTAVAADVAPETQYVLNSFLFLFGGALVMFMAAGFCMLEAGLVRSKNVGDICLKNVALYAIAGIMYYLIGYDLMYTDVSGFIGTLSIWDGSQGAPGSDPVEAAAGEYAAHSDWFFQMVFVATAASIVSGAVAERVKLFPFLTFVVILTAVIYPVQGAWKWGGGFLDGIGFSDFAGSTIVHSVGGWAALTGALIVGARTGKYEGGRVHAMPGSSLPLATLGTFVLWLGWFGFNGASQLAMGTVDDVVALSRIFANTNMAAAGGVLATLLLTKALYRKVDLTLVLNGALAGLVSITAEPLTPSVGQAIGIGMVGAALVNFAIPLLDRWRIDDVVGAIPVHLVAGIFGTLVVPVTNPEATFWAQLFGIAVVAAWVVPTSSLVWFALKKTVGVRLSPEEELIGGDALELGLEAYPEFGGRPSGDPVLSARPVSAAATRTAPYRV